MRNTIDNSQQVIDSRDLIARIEELQEQRTPYVTGWNMPGYLPDAEPSRYETADDARESLADELERAADECDERADHAEQSGDDEDKRGVASEREQAEQLREQAEELRGLTHEGSLAEFGRTIGAWHYWVTFDPSPTAGLDDDDAAELQTLESFANELRGYGDFEHGESLIRDDYFTEYAEELARDCGMLGDADTTKWPLYCLDWDRAADELKHDYVSADFDGVTYWMRA
jgi:hypothetical protein